MSKRPVKVFVKDSNIPEIGKRGETDRFSLSTREVSSGKGLFAYTEIKKGSIIAEFKGKLKKTSDRAASSRSNIYFHDESFLECPSTDLASFANDAIDFNNHRRQLMKALNSDEPFYKKHPGALVNAFIKINNDLHRAFLIAEDDISINQEIFCHYGFTYWFRQEISRVGFLQEDEIDQNGFPGKIFEYPAFISYVKEFYPKYVSHEVKKYGDTYDVFVHLGGDDFILINIEDFSTKIKKINPHEFKKLEQSGYFNEPTQ